MLFVAFLLISVISVNSHPLALVDAHQVIDYYWRDYDGIIPDDAIPGGADNAGNPTYIGQAYFKDCCLLPATITRGSSKVRTSAGGRELFSEKNVKILCSGNQDRYRWIAVKLEEMHLLTKCHLVISGTEGGYAIYLGRIYHDRSVVIGKVFSHDSAFRGFHIPYQGKEAHYFTFEVLTYNCDVVYDRYGQSLLTNINSTKVLVV